MTEGFIDKTKMNIHMLNIVQRRQIEWLPLWRHFFQVLVASCQSKIFSAWTAPLKKCSCFNQNWFNFVVSLWSTCAIWVTGDLENCYCHNFKANWIQVSTPVSPIKILKLHVLDEVIWTKRWKNWESMVEMFSIAGYGICLVRRE